MSIGLRSSLGLGLLLLVAACTAAVSKDEPSASSAAAETTGFSCSAKNVKMPAKLPDVGTCINDTDGKGGEDGCNGWTKAGAYQLGDDELRSLGKKGAQLYEIKPDDSTLCLYLYRGDATVSTGSLNGVHCYNTSTCDVCWWDGATDKGVKPTVDILKHESSDNCSDCHRNGPLLPKSVLWNAISDDTSDLHIACAGAGGATWADPIATWPLASPDAKSVVEAPSGCVGCHSNGFASGGNYCAQVNHTFADATGSMRGAKKRFKTADDCTTFRTAMGCADADIDCTSADIVAGTASAPAGDDDDSIDTANTSVDDTPPADATDPTDPTPAAGDDADAGADDGNAHSRKRHSAFKH